MSGKSISRRMFFKASTGAVLGTAAFGHFHSTDGAVSGSFQEQETTLWLKAKQIAPTGIVEKRLTGRLAQKLADIVLRMEHEYHSALVGYPESLSKSGVVYLAPEVHQLITEDTDNRRIGIIEDGIDYINYSLEVKVEGVWASKNTATVIWSQKVGIQMTGDPDPVVPSMFYETGMHCAILQRDGSSWRVVMRDVPLFDEPRFDASGDFGLPEELKMEEKQPASRDRGDRSSRVEEDVPPLSSLAVSGTYDRIRASNYAMTYGPMPGENGYHVWNNNCTNFVSQCMRAGGWRDIGGYYKNSDVWWYNGIWPYGSYTWAGAQNFNWFLIISGRGSFLRNIWDMVAGDVVLYDDDKLDGISHAQICHYRSGSGMLYMAQHSPGGNYAWKPLSDVLAGDEGRGWIYPYRLRTSY